MAANTANRLAPDDLAPLLEKAVDTAADVVACLAADGRVVYANAAASRALGYTPEELLALSALDLEPGLTLETVATRFQELRRRSGLSIESYLKTKDGQLRPVELTASLGVVGGSEFAIVFAHSIGRRRKAQETIQQTRRRLSWMLEALGQGVWEWNVASGEVQFSPQWLEALGYPADTAGSVEFWQSLIHPDDVESVRTSFDAHLEGQSPHASVEYRIRTKAGDWRWTLDRAKVVEHGPDGAPLRVVGASTDLSAIKRAQEENRESSRLISVLFDAAPVGIVSLGPDRLVRSWNAAAERIFGWTASEVVGRPLPVFQGASADESDRTWQEIVSGGSVLGVEREAVSKDGGNLTIRLSTVPLRAADGRPTGVLGLLEDVTEQKRLGEELLHAQRLENIGRLAGAVAHDFNNLLTVINGYGEIALAALDVRDPLYESIREIKSAGDRAAVLTQQLLAFSRRQVMQPKVLNINDVVGDMELMLRRLVGENVALVLARDPATGDVKADPGQVQQVIMNLAVNARDAMPEGGTLTIETGNVVLGEELRRGYPDLAPGPYVALSVRDTGTGMDERTLARLFEPFFTTKEKGKGTGLGLSTAYGIVKQSGGHIQVRSEEGQGSVFTVYLPRTSDSAAAARPEAEAAALTGHETILLVEDQAEVRQVALHALERYGYRVVAAAGGDEALEQIRREKAGLSLILTDVMMPGMTGTDLAASSATIQPGIKVLFMSGYTDEVSMPPGADYIQKPFTPERLARKVREMLDRAPGAAAAPGQVRILVVDDEAEIRKLLRQILESAGYEVAEAADGKRAVAEVDAGGIGLVITDLVMPEKEGIETIREMRRSHPGLRIIAMSGAFGGRFLRTAEMLGAQATLSKPVRADVLVRTVRSVLAG